jgi:CRP/FNR family transcriptional regulator, cyclic AMP receptor protein
MSEPGVNGVQTVGLLDVEPDLRMYLAPDERLVAGRVAIPVLRLSARALDVDALLEEAGAFGAVILEGVLLHRMAIGDQPALRLLGPGDMLSRSGGFRTALLSHSSYRSTGPLRIAIFDDRVLLTARRFPRLFAGLQIRMGEQHQRLAAQLVICQLPRVEDRLLALMWLLAETWGRVTASGTVLPIALTHDALGELIGARRPTVTLALKELAERGSLFRQDGEWLLLEPPPQGRERDSVRADPKLSPVTPSRWAETPPDEDSELGPGPGRHELDLQELEQLISALRDTHRRTTTEVRARLERARRTRERTLALRDQITRQQDQLSRRQRPPAQLPAP